VETTAVTKQFDTIRLAVVGDLHRKFDASMSWTRNRAAQKASAAMRWSVAKC
jgi:hypothetical protein